MKKISTSRAPRPSGHYSQAIEHQGIVYVSGQLPIRPDGEKVEMATIEEQTEQVLENLNAILIDAGSGKDRVLKVTIYISDIEAWGRVNAVYARFFGEHHPARSVVPTRRLHYGFKVEIDAIAFIGTDSSKRRG